MEYYKKITLKDGRDCILRNCTENDGADVLDVFLKTHEQTDFMLTYTDENTMTPEQEGDFLKCRTESPNEVEILAQVGGRAVGTAGITSVGNRVKLRHRADFGIGIEKEYWGLGIGRALTEACIECAKKAGYEQLELSVVSENEKAVALYKSLGFTEYGRDPRGFKSRLTGYQELIYMKLEL